MDPSLLLSIVSTICVLFTFIVRLMVKAALADFLKDLNGTYVRSIFYSERHRELERRLSLVEQYLLKSPNTFTKDDHV